MESLVLQIEDVTLTGEYVMFVDIEGAFDCEAFQRPCDVGREQTKSTKDSKEVW